MNRKQKYYLAVFVLVGGAFIVDQAFLGEPESASAKPTGSAKRKTKHQSTKEKNANEQPSDPSIAYLEKIMEMPLGRDIFMPSSDMLSYYKQLQSIAEEQESQEAGPQPGSPEAFEAKHELQATFLSKGKMLTIVSGRILQLGERLDGFRVTRIAPYMVEFRRGRDRVTLYLPMPVQLE